jgi:hypothetical protein
MIVGFPHLKYEIDFEYNSGDEIRMLVDRHSENAFAFARKSGRWRWVCGPFVGIHTIASRIFEYGDNPTRQEMEFMGDYVSTIGDLIDVAQKAISEGVEERLRYREQAALQRQNDYFQAMSYDEPDTFIYLMSHQNGLTKIGKSNNPRTRERTLQAEDPRLEMIFHCKANGSIETRLHKIFDSVRVRGEWFNLMPHHVDWIVLLLDGINRMELANAS